MRLRLRYACDMRTSVGRQSGCATTTTTTTTTCVLTLSIVSRGTWYLATYTATVFNLTLACFSRALMHVCGGVGARVRGCVVLVLLLHTVVYITLRARMSVFVLFYSSILLCEALRTYMHLRHTKTILIG